MNGLTCLWRQQAPLKRRQTSTRLHDATTQKSQYSPSGEPQIPQFSSGMDYIFPVIFWVRFPCLGIDWVTPWNRNLDSWPHRDARRRFSGVVSYGVQRFFIEILSQRLNVGVESLSVGQTPSCRMASRSSFSLCSDCCVGVGTLVVRLGCVGLRCYAFFARCAWNELIQGWTCLSVFLSVWFNSRTGGLIWMKFGMDVMPLGCILKYYFSISYDR
jgi:hypothetical protein